MISTRMNDQLNLITGEKRNLLVRMLEWITDKYYRGFREHGEALDKIPNIDEALGEANDLTTYLFQYRDVVIKSIFLIDSGLHQEARDLLEAQLKPRMDPGLKHTLEQLEDE